MLKSDLGGRTDQPSATLEGSSKAHPLRDLVVEAAVRLVKASPMEVHCSEYSNAGRDYWREVYGNQKLFTWLGQQTK